jgi:hypothetical protein
MALGFPELTDLGIEIRDEKRPRMNSALKVGSYLLEQLEKIKEAFTNLTAETSERQTADTALQSSISVAGPDCLVAGSMTDLYEKLNTSSWWLNGHTISGKALIRQIRVFNWFFTLIVTRSEVLTQYLFGPVKLNPDNSFTQGEAYFESYILKRVLFPDGSGGTNNKWHYVDRSDFLNVDEYKPRESGYYTAQTARAAVVSSLRKGGLVITYRTGENTWTVEQAKGASNWTDGSNWKAVGSGSGGDSIDLSDIEDSIADLAEALTVHTGNTGVHIIDLGENPDTDEINTPGCYRYRESRPGSPVRQNYYMTVAGSEQTGVLQFRYSAYGLEKREQDGEGWGEWQAVGGGIEEAPQDGKIYARQNGQWVVIQEPEPPSTEIEFEVTVPDGSGEIPVLVRMSSPSGNGQAVIHWGDGTSETVSVPAGIPQEAELADGSTYSWTEGAPFGHAWAEPGTYEVRIAAYDSVNAVSFSTRQAPGEGDWAARPVDSPRITAMKKFKSGTLQSLYYTFAGLVSMKMEDDFVLETPQVSDISFMMWGCGKNLEDFTLPAGLLSQITLPQTCYRTFMESGVRFLPEGLLDSLTELSVAFEMFRACSRLGYYWYDNPMSNYGQNEFIPVTLFQKLTKLQNITGIFNWTGQGFFGNWPSGYSYGAPVRKDLFRNTQIVTADYAFYKWNRINIEPDVFGHIKNTLASAEGVFAECNWCTPGIGWGTVRDGFTGDLNEIFPDTDYPSINNLIAAFAPTDATLSFNGTIEVSGAHPQVKLDIAAFTAKFPNCKAGSASEGRDGRAGAFKNLQDNCDNWDTVAAIDGGIWTD